MDNFIDMVMWVFVVVVLMVVTMGFPTMWLWNALVPEIFNLPSIGFWQAVGLNLLTTILFKPVIKGSGTSK